MARRDAPAHGRQAAGSVRRRIALVLGLVILALFALTLVREPVPPTGAWLARAGLTAQFESIDGLRIRYVRAGAGPPVVLVHGFGSSIYTWKDVLPELARQHDVVALDLPGFGGSGIPATVSADLMPSSVLGLMDRLGLRHASFVGNSLGGATAVWIASSDPARVDRLALIDSAGFHLGPGDRPPLVRLLALPGASLAAHLPLVRLATRQTLLTAFFDPRHVTEERLDEYTAPNLRPGAAAYLMALARQPDPAQGRFAEWLARIQVPTLVLWGREDRWLPVADADRFGAALPDARVVVLERCGHVPQEELPGRVSRLLLDFLGGAGATAEAGADPSPSGP